MIKGRRKGTIWKVLGLLLLLFIVWAITLPPVEETESLPHVDAPYQYIYDMMDQEQQKISFVCDDLPYEELDTLLNELIWCPEFFWIDGWEYNAQGNEYDIEFTWKYDDVQTKRQQVEAAAEQALGAIPPEAGDYEKALALHDWLCDNIEYGFNSDGSDQDLYGALALGRCVCAGYSAAYEYLLDMVGIEADTILGEAINGDKLEKHTWTKAILEGDIYYIDVTWDDYDDIPSGHLYSWFAVTSDRMESSHFPDTENGFEMPEATAVACNYHYRNGWVLEEFDINELTRILSEQSGVSLTVLAADESVYEQLVELAMNADATINILYSAGHPTNEYIYTCDDAALCLDISPA